MAIGGDGDGYGYGSGDIGSGSGDIVQGGAGCPALIIGRTRKYGQNPAEISLLQSPVLWTLVVATGRVGVSQDGR